MGVSKNERPGRRKVWATQTGKDQASQVHPPGGLFLPPHVLTRRPGRAVPARTPGIPGQAAAPSRFLQVRSGAQRTHLRRQEREPGPRRRRRHEDEWAAELSSGAPRSELFLIIPSAFLSRCSLGLIFKSTAQAALRPPDCDPAKCQGTTRHSRASRKNGGHAGLLKVCGHTLLRATGTDHEHFGSLASQFSSSADVPGCLCKMPGGVDGAGELVSPEGRVTNLSPVARDWAPEVPRSGRPLGPGHVGSWPPTRRLRYLGWAFRLPSELGDRF